MLLPRYIRLTSDRPSQQGWLFSRVPLTATNWEVTSRRQRLQVRHAYSLTDRSGVQDTWPWKPLRRWDGDVVNKAAWHSWASLWLDR